MRENIETFLVAAYDHLLRWPGSRQRILENGLDDDGTWESRYDWVSQQATKTRNELLTGGRELAALLAANGHDETELLTFLHSVHVNGFELESVLPLWGPLVVSLQKILNRAGLPPPAATPPALSTKKGEGKAGDRATETPPNDDALSERAQLVLQVLYQKESFDSDRRITTAEIVATGQGNDPNAFKDVVADLRERGYVQTKKGRGGGVWLTEAGKVRAGKL